MAAEAPDNRCARRRWSASSRLRAIPFAGCFRPKLCNQMRETLAVLGKVDAVRLGSEDRNARGLQFRSQLQRRLPPKLHDDAEQFALFRLARDDLEHVFGGQWLEIEPVGRVRVGRNGLGIAIDHDGLEPAPRRGPSAKAAWQQQ